MVIEVSLSAAGRQGQLSAAFRPQHNLIARETGVFFRRKPVSNMYLIKVPSSRHLYLMQLAARKSHQPYI
jgi:hypothetical protein